MLRVEAKKDVIQILENIGRLCKIAQRENGQMLLTILQECQDAVISLGEYFERNLEDSGEMIAQMERLCELFYLVSQDLERRVTYEKEICQMVQSLLAYANGITDAYQIVFFPYKADMWDSLESIWLTCKTDSRCDCKVVPIPYYHYDAKNNVWNYCYEIDKFPSYVPVIDYQEYDLTQQPDAAFIHNPYDQYNHVTHVHSDYYSYNLKKYVRNLFYVPYYVTSGFISEDHKLLSAYANADYLVVQSETFKDGLKIHGFDKKALVLGSPKLDRVIRLSDTQGNIPRDWEERIGHRKSIMLNTSLSQFLADGEAYLKKIAYIFNMIKERDDVVLIWRPHPLLKSTIESMRPHLLGSYKKLQEQFIEENIGILDTTPDIVQAVAVADAYIGETASSVINLFQAAGKPLFILNNYIDRSYTEEEKQRVHIYDCEVVDDTLYCVPVNCGGVLMVSEDDWSQVRFCKEIERIPEWTACYRELKYKDGQLHISSANRNAHFIYDISNKNLEKVELTYKGRPWNPRYMVSYKNKIFYLPTLTKAIGEYDICTGIWKEYEEPIRVLQKNVQEHILEDIVAYVTYENKIWMTNLYSNAVLCFDMETAQYTITYVGNEQRRYSAIETDGMYIYLGDAYSGNIEVWDMQFTTHVTTYVMPTEYRAFLNFQGRGAAHLRLILVDGILLGIPCTSNALVKINLHTGQIQLLASEFFAPVMQPQNKYKPEVHGVVCFAKLLDGRRLLLQRRCDSALLDLDIYTESYHVHMPRYADGEVDGLLHGKDGFEKRHTHAEFARRESEWFSLESFLDDLCRERMKDAMIRQKKEMETMAVNLDGSCGEKVHEFMMGVLTS